MAPSLPPGRVSPPVFLCESTRYWATWWRSRVASLEAGPPLKLVELRSVSECRREVALVPAAFVMQELTSANVAAVLEWLDEPPRGLTPSAVIVKTVVAARELSAWEMIVREAGAVGWATTPLEFWRLMTMAERFAERHAPPSADLTESIWAALPWRAVEPPPSDPLDLIDPIHFIEEP